jgi:hypothetical protein
LGTLPGLVWFGWFRSGFVLVSFWFRSGFVLVSLGSWFRSISLGLVWRRPDATQEPECAYKTIHSSQGNLTRRFSQSKLEDYSAQLELIFNNNKTMLCTNDTLLTVIGVPDTFVQLVNPKVRGKRSMNDVPTGIIRLANHTKYCLSYPKLDIYINVKILSCATEDNIETSDGYLSTIERCQNFQFLESGLILLTGHILHPLVE